jgi:cobalt-zinc-cadmium resistance protein CzcA
VLNALIEGSLKNRFFVLLATLGVALLGVRSAWLLPLDAIPDLTNVQVQVITEAPGLSPPEIEAMLSFPVEGVLGGLPNVEQVRSISKFGISVVTVVFHEGTDLLRARQLVAERLPLASEAIPPGYGLPKLGPMATALSEVMQFQVKGEGYTPMELRSILDWFLTNQLRTVPGVTEINPHGGVVKTYQIRLDPDKLANYGLSLPSVFEAVNANNRNVGGGYLVRDGEARYIRGESQIVSASQIAQIVLDEREGVPVRVSDVAEVEVAPLVRSGLATRDGEGEIVTGLVMMLIGENAREVVGRVKEEIERLGPSLPPGVSIEVLYDRTDLVRHALDTVFHNLLEGGILVIAVLLVLLGNLTGGLIVASVIPLSMLFASSLMLGFGVSASLMSLGAIDFGLIVDSSVIMVENCVRRLGIEGRTRSRAAIVLDAAIEVRKPTLFGELIIAIVFLPILTLEGVEGKLFRPMALTVIFALLGSMILSMTAVPALASLLLRPGRGEEHDVWLVRLIKRAYEPILGLVQRHPAATALTAALLFLGTIPLAGNLGAEFMPRLNEGDLLIEAVRIPSASLEGAVDASTRIEKVLREFPEVKTVYCKTGRPEIANDVMGVHQTDVWTLLKPMEEWRPGVTRDDLIAAMDEALTSKVPGVAFGFSQPIEMRVNELVAGVKSDVAVLIYGPELEVLRAKSEEVARVLSGLKGAQDLKVPASGQLPMLRVAVRRDQLARYGIDANDVMDAVSALGGKTVGVVMEGQARYAIQVRFPESWREDPERIKAIRLADPMGRAIALGDLADVLLEEGPSEVERDHAQRRAVVGVNVRGRDLAGFVADAERSVAESVDLPPGYVIRWGGQFEHLQTASKRLMLVVPVTLAMIFLLLYASSQSVRTTILIALALPMATTGGVVALALRGLPFSISAGIGFIALSGVAVLNGMVWMNAATHLHQRGLSARESAHEASLTRLRPILMTALTGGLGFLPMALATSPGAEIQRPLATVVIGGLITSTLLTTLVVPAIYPWFAGKSREVDAAAS